MKTLSKEERHVLKHSLGISHGKRSYRNYFVTYPECDSWQTVQGLVRRGLMKLIAEASFAVTDAGKEALQRKKGSKMNLDTAELIGANTQGRNIELLKLLTRINRRKDAYNRPAIRLYSEDEQFTLLQEAIHDSDEFEKLEFITFGSKDYIIAFLEGMAHELSA